MLAENRAINITFGVSSGGKRRINEMFQLDNDDAVRKKNRKLNNCL